MNINLTLPIIDVKHPVTDAVLFTVPAITLDRLELVLIDEPAFTAPNGRVIRPAQASVRFRNIPRARPLVLWSGTAYDAAGDYTQADLETRVLELLGSDPAAVITALIQLPAARRAAV